jgi:hypothetical protein
VRCTPPLTLPIVMPSAFPAITLPVISVRYTPCEMVDDTSAMLLLKLSTILFLTTSRSFIPFVVVVSSFWTRSPFNKLFEMTFPTTIDDELTPVNKIPCPPDEVIVESMMTQLGLAAMTIPVLFEARTVVPLTMTFCPLTTEMPGPSLDSTNTSFTYVLFALLAASKFVIWIAPSLALPHDLMLTLSIVKYAESTTLTAGWSNVPQSNTASRLGLSTAEK